MNLFEPKLISPMLDNFIMGAPISEHDGVRCCPAMENNSNEKYIVKIISIPSSQTQLDALLLTGAYQDKAAALRYFRDIADGVVDEVKILTKLAQLKGFQGYQDIQQVPMEDDNGYEIYLLSPYRRTLARNLERQPMTHLAAVNLGLDICSALAVCRRSGYIYVDLKPQNIFVTEEQAFRIGDLGFIRLDSLKYASLPDKYRSPYTPPEISDAYASLNATIDTFGLGMILYQIYNDLKLPSQEELASGEIAPPQYADYEMSEIILKACAKNPEDRWTDPVQMGQALVAYMQRNGANDTPILPLTYSAPLTAPTADSETIKEENEETGKDSVDADINTSISEFEQSVYTEDDLGNFSFLDDLTGDETLPDSIDTDIAYEDLTDEVSSILTLADDLAAHPVPEANITTSKPEVPQLTDAENKADETVSEDIAEKESNQQTIIVSVKSDEAEAVNPEQDAISVPPLPDISSFEPDFSYDEDDYSDENDEEAQEVSKVKRKRSYRWVGTLLLVVSFIGLMCCGAYYFMNYYLQSIDSIRVVGEEDGLLVYVESPVDETLLYVVCSDAYGNRLVAPVTNGQATFTSLVPDTGYNISIQIKGFHKLTGSTSTAYSTPVQTNIVQLSAVSGAEDGSVILGFTVDGPDSEQWRVTYSASGEEEKIMTFRSHMVTITGLTIGKEYTFTLTPESDLYISGIDSVSFIASKIICAENLKVDSCSNNTLQVSWDTPADTIVQNWTVRCYNDSGFSESQIVSENHAAFSGLDHLKGYTIEVTAAGMSVQERILLPANSLTITNLSADISDPSRIALTWDANGVPKTGWLILYTLNNAVEQNSITCTGNSATISNPTPGATYHITIQQTDGTPVFVEELSITIPVASS